MKRHVIHPYACIIDSNSEKLILGSVPSIKSIENHFFYGNPYNRFWPLMSMLLKVDLANASNEVKKEVLLKNKIALYDVVYECDIVDSNDNKITNIKVSDINHLLSISKIKKIYLNGESTYKIFKTYFPLLLPLSVKLPSTSPRNASYSLEHLYEKWKKIID